MNRWVLHSILSAVLFVAVSAPVLAQAQPRRLSTADVAAVALQNNLQLRAAAFEVAVAEAQLAQARGARMPQVVVSGSYTRQGLPGQTLSFPNPFGPVPPVITFTIPPPDPNLLALRLALQFPLYTGGRLESQIVLAEANLRGARAVFERIKEQIVFAAQQTYLQALLGQENVAAAARARESAAENLRVARARVQSGAAPQFDVVQAEVTVARAEQSALAAETSVRSAHADLNALLNLPLDAPIAPADTLAPQPVDGMVLDAIARALRDRPELVEVRSRMEAARASIELAASGGRPSLTLSAGYDLSGSSPASMDSGWSVTLGVTLLISDGGVTRERIREAELRLAQLRVLEARTRQTVELEVRQAWLSQEQAAGQLDLAAKAVEQAREAARLAAVRYQAGVGTSLEVISAQTVLAEAELGLASARFGQNLARLRILLATGAF
ncbi:MAG TPA: TolC family protein [bacterium]|nr:TolC family protein [bacterium]